MGKKNISCCFTGHRVNKLPWRENEESADCLALKEKIYDAAEAAYGSGIRHFICGMALGCDMYFCEAVIKLRAYYGNISLEAAIPCEEQNSKWTAWQKKRYDRLVSECDIFTVVSKTYSPDCYLRRNRYMVDNSSLLIAAYNGSSGGTQSTILYAIRQGLEVIEIPV